MCMSVLHACFHLPPSSPCIPLLSLLASRCSLLNTNVVRNCMFKHNPGSWKQQITMASFNTCQLNETIVQAVWLFCLFSILSRKDNIFLGHLAPLLSPSTFIYVCIYLSIFLSLRGPAYLLSSFHPQHFCPHVPIVLSACPLFPSWLSLPPYMPPVSR